MELLIVGLILLVLIGVLAVAVGLRRQWADAGQLPGRVARLEAELEAKSEQVIRLEKDATIHREELDGLRQEKAKLDTELATTTQVLKHAKEDALQQEEILNARFRKLSAELLENHGSVLKSQNKEQIEGLLKPLRERIIEFEQGLTIRHTQAAEQHAALKEQISQLGKLNQAMADEAGNLSRALKGQTQTQGAWGEMILETILEKSGLREGIEFVRQESLTDADGRRLRPDVIVNLPGAERVIVDSKVSLTAFETFVNSEDDEEKRRALAAHVKSLRAHIDGLAKKDYTGAAGSRLDYVILFVPIEGALAVALGAEAELASHAIERNVAMATPTTLMTLLRTVGAMWRIEHQHQNAEEIAERAGRLYDKFVGFAESLDSVGQRIDQARDAFDRARGQLVTGSGNLVRQVEMIKGLGARAKKTLPRDLVSDADPDETRADPGD